MVSFSGILTFKKSEALREVARKVPADGFLVETDAPYLAPVPHRGKVNTRAMSAMSARRSPPPATNLRNKPPPRPPPISSAFFLLPRRKAN